MPAPDSAVAWVDQVLADAVAKRASDIHFEPLGATCRIRLRIDGLLEEHAQLPQHLTDAVTARIKVMAQLDIGEKRLPQDGRLKLTQANAAHEFRVSSCPTLFGEKIVLRHVDALIHLPKTDQLGMRSEQHAQLEAALACPWGLILVTGPTGSGKTVTLYAALQQLNQTHRNISTIEDPIEMTLPGVNQVAHHEGIGLTFAHALRAFLRQDPDVLMIGEIRDRTTAKIAVQAAQTGHLILSTLHTNTALATLTRLLHLGVDRADVASACRLIIAQTLMRTLHACKTHDRSTSAQRLMAKSPGAKVYRAVGCPACRRGYLGRTGVFETLPITQTLQAHIAQGHSDVGLAAQIQKQGGQTLNQAALAHVLEGRSSMAEYQRITATLNEPSVAGLA